MFCVRLETIWFFICWMLYFMFVSSTWLIMLNSSTSLFFFSFSFQSSVCIGYQKKCARVLCFCFCLFLLSSGYFCFIYFEVMLLGAYMFRIVYLPHEFSLLKLCPSLRVKYKLEVTFS